MKQSRMGQSIKAMTFGTFILNIYTRVLYISGDFNLATSHFNPLSPTGAYQHREALF